MSLAVNKSNPRTQKKNELKKIAGELAKYILQGESESFTQIMEQIASSENKKNLNRILNKCTYTFEQYDKIPLLVLAANKDNIEIVQSILKYEVCMHLVSYY